MSSRKIIRTNKGNIRIHKKYIKPGRLVRSSGPSVWCVCLSVCLCYYCKNLGFPKKTKVQEGPRQNINKTMVFQKNNLPDGGVKNALRFSPPSGTCFVFWGLFWENHGFVNVLSGAFLFFCFVEEHPRFLQ